MLVSEMEVVQLLGLVLLLAGVGTIIYFLRKWLENRKKAIEVVERNKTITQASAREDVPDVVGVGSFQYSHIIRLLWFTIMVILTVMSGLLFVTGRLLPDIKGGLVTTAEFSEFKTDVTKGFINVTNGVKEVKEDLVDFGEKLSRVERLPGTFTALAGKIDELKEELGGVKSGMVKKSDLEAKIRALNDAIQKKADAGSSAHIIEALEKRLKKVEKEVSTTLEESLEDE
jgi:hypothetical protein